MREREDNEIVSLERSWTLKFGEKSEILKTF